MKNVKFFKHFVTLIFVITAGLFLQSCVVNNPYYTRQLVTVPEIIQMSKDGVPSKDIISDIRKTHTVYGLKASQLANLREKGVQDSVINYMEKTRIDAIGQNQGMQNSYYWFPGIGGYMYGMYGGLGWGWPYYGFGGFWGPSVVFSYRGGGFHGGGGFNGGFHGGFHGTRR
jgi:hypothetical protein